ncbi:putative atp-dependent rna helicase mss116 [Phaeomoniella chlamydospora]|uniref:ATP-dependent RNA helicase n=1 Tax=Phaeomoniella chlamydospora TaxID=158046 RepID=A0A0G2GP04_PHACM|nr:putative atp-dependent rna helicase mss116 [Phaeomoniella chlamydospora]
MDTPRFADLAQEKLVHPILLTTIVDDLKFDHMMPVQAATLHDLLREKVDCLAQAKTGTGKTIAFLLPAIQNMVITPRTKKSISLLVLSPTRELAMQIAKEAEKLLQRMPNYKVRTAIGGTNKIAEASSILQGCDILVATPGRLLDHLSDEEMRLRLVNLKTLVLDEADRMLDMGFLPDIRKILGFLPDKRRIPRQSMLFSATLEGQIQDVAHLILNEGHKFISTITPGEAGTHERVPQRLVVVPTMTDLAPALVASVKVECINPSDFKAIIFAPTAALADFYGQILRAQKGLPPTSILHSRISQTKRTRITQEFREAPSAICVATDVIARGMDFPNVSHVFQIGLPADKASYVHRLGRTARADANGRGILLLAKPEQAFLHQLKDVTFQSSEPLVYSKADIDPLLSRVENKEKVYQSWLGYYKSSTKLLGWSPAELVRQANIFALEGLGCSEIPALEKKTIGKMGLKGVSGLVVKPNAPGSNDDRARGGGEGRRTGR